MSMPRSDSRSSTCRSDRGKRTYIITARRITSGEVLKYRNGFFIQGRYKIRFSSSIRILLTIPLRDEEVKAFVHERGDDFAQAIEQVVKEDQSPEKVRDIIRLTAADLADLCP